MVAAKGGIYSDINHTTCLFSLVESDELYNEKEVD